jgi:signal transduction histidine kinase
MFARNFSRPIQNITEVARNVALMNFKVRAEENLSTTELRDLSYSINLMADNLKKLISDLQTSNEKLQADFDKQIRLDKMRREFVANVSHELKSPLHLLLMYTENLKNNVDNIDKDYYCNTIIEETNRLNDMVKSLLDLSAIENGLEKMRKETLNLSELSENVISKSNLLFQKATVSASIEKDIFVEGDSRYMEQVIKNYFANAVAHTPENGRILITLMQKENDAIFSVFNEGSTIAEEDILHIWESFYKTDKARTREDETHVGLGLYIVKSIMQAHGGDYGVKNIDPQSAIADSKSFLERANGEAVDKSETPAGFDKGVEFWFSLQKKIKM